MSEPASNPSEIDAAAALNAEIEEVIALCGGDVRAALRATLIANAYLQDEVARLAESASVGFGRRRVRGRPGPEDSPEKQAG